MQPKKQESEPKNPPNCGSSVSESDEVFLELLKKDSKELHKLKHKIRDLTLQRHDTGNAMNLFDIIESIEKLVK